MKRNICNLSRKKPNFLQIRQNFAHLFRHIFTRPREEYLRKSETEAIRSMNPTQRLLQAIAENGHTGVNACDQLLKRTADAELRGELVLERQHYFDAMRDAENLLLMQGIAPRKPGPAAQMGLWMGMQINTIADRSAAHIADIVIQGATMGVVELTKARNSNPDADAQAQGIASFLITKQQEAIDRLKRFLAEKQTVKQGS